jgi:hypothetical protein
MNQSEIEMKKIMMAGFMFVGLLLQAEAQQSSGKKKNVVRKSTAKKAKASPRNENTVSLTNSSANQARGTATQQELRISDPTVLELNQRAAGGSPTTSPVIGMPKSTYGIANGKILLRNTTATTSGTAYGSGAVGTGTSIVGAGTSESTLGVNGKSPYAGPWLWGERRPAYPIRDSSQRQ